MKTTINELKNLTDNEVTLRGWVYHIRSMGKVWFLILRDGTGLLQCVVVKSEVESNVFDLKSTLSQESSVTVTGVVRSEKRAIGGVELGVRSINVIQVAAEYPISPKEHGTAFLMDNRHLWIRSKRQHAILKIRAQVIRACRDFFDSNQFTLVDSPVFTGNAVEGTTDLFEVDYFGRSAYLTQSGQLYVEAAAMALGKVYCFGPTFRAEKSKTRRHLTEFWMVEPEMAYCDLHENMNWAEKLVTYIVTHCLKTCQDEFSALERDTSALEAVTLPFPRITYDQAVEILKKKNPDFEYGSDFGGTDETLISEEFTKPVMIHHWPADTKAFYMKRDEENHELALGVDMIAPEGYGEIVGGGQREDDHDTLLSRIRHNDLPVEPFQWYLDLRKYGSVPHSGFGLGIERVVAWVSGIAHIRETIPFPRTLHRLFP